MDHDSAASEIGERMRVSESHDLRIALTDGALLIDRFSNDIKDASKSSTANRDLRKEHIAEI